jgi:hypothetical protein
VANTFVDPTSVVRLGLALVVQDLVLAATMNRDYEADFGGGKGATVNVRVPAVLAARDRGLHDTGAITADEILEDTVPVSITGAVYSAVFVDDADLTLSVEDFGRQVLAPQVLAVVENLEDKGVAAMQAVAETTSIAYDAAAPEKTFTAARKALRDLGIPASGLFAAVGTGIYADLLDAKAITDASQSGSTGALREATVGRVRGFEVVESNRLADKEMVFYHRSAFTLAIRAPKVPDGVSFGESKAEKGFAMRWIKDYDSMTTRERSVVSTFVGVQAMTVATTEKHGEFLADGVTPNPDEGKAIRVTPAIRVLGSTA